LSPSIVFQGSGTKVSVEGDVHINRVGLNRVEIDLNDSLAADQMIPEFNGKQSALATSDEKGRVFVDGKPVESYVVPSYLGAKPEHQG